MCLIEGIELNKDIFINDRIEYEQILYPDVSIGARIIFSDQCVFVYIFALIFLNIPQKGSQPLTFIFLIYGVISLGKTLCFYSTYFLLVLRSGHRYRRQLDLRSFTAQLTLAV